MKILRPSNKFKKGSKKLDKKTDETLTEKLHIFEENEFDQRLNNHKLHGEYVDCRSINITSDVRIIYKKVAENIYVLMAIGTHSELYS